MSAPCPTCGRDFADKVPENTTSSYTLTPSIQESLHEIVAALKDIEGALTRNV